jgi:hypothetical protein
MNMHRVGWPGLEGFAETMGGSQRFLRSSGQHNPNSLYDDALAMTGSEVGPRSDTDFHGMSQRNAFPPLVQQLILLDVTPLWRKPDLPKNFSDQATSSTHEE